MTQFGVKTLNERNNSPQEYCRLYRERYLPAENSNLALGARIVWIDAPAEKYRASGGKDPDRRSFRRRVVRRELDGLGGQRDGAFVVDPGRDVAFSTVETDFLHRPGR
ncbi:MAG: hypothetical protein ACLUFW_10710 [Alistipes sp.]